MDDAWPTVGELLVIHELLIDRFGGMRGVTEQGFGKLEAALAAPHVSMFGEDLYPDIPSKLAVLFYRLARAHGFSDGNKRVALLALLEAIERNGMRLVADEEELYTFVMFAADTAGQDEVIAWLLPRLVTGARA
jgi:death-on-curing protein